jgi:hypothetical protein
MLFSFSRLKQFLPVLLIIVGTILVISYRNEIEKSLRASIGDQEETFSKKIAEAAINLVLGEENDNDEKDDENSSDDSQENADETVDVKIYSIDESLSEEVNEGDPISDEESEQALTVHAELADTEEERIRGLMYRESLCDDCGMLFVFNEDSQGGFWMKNCEISLDIIFIDEEGLIVDMAENFEPCPANPCPVYDPKHSYRYALEVNGGWAEENKVRIGDSVEVPV